MRKPVVPRLIGFFALYCVVFVLLGAVQFTKSGKFTQRIGAMTVSGHWLPLEQEADVKEFLLSGSVNVFFGGLEFLLEERGDDGFVLIDEEGGRQAAQPERMLFDGDTARFRLSGGTEIAFNTRYSDGPELRISGLFSDGVSGMEIPYKPRRSSSVREAGNGKFAIVYNGLRYQFVQSSRGEENGRLALQPKAPLVSYRAMTDRQVFNPADFAIAHAEDAHVFNDAISHWKDQSYSWWGQNISSQNDEDVVIAYSGEAVHRGNYRPAIAAISSAFLSGTQRGWESSVYLGGMDRARRLFVAAEQEKISRLSRLINEQSTDFFAESRVFDFLMERGLADLVNDGAELSRMIDPAALTLPLCSGIFEGYAFFAQHRPGRDNPFEQLIEPACQLISENIHRENDQVFVFDAGTAFGAGAVGVASADVELNLRLGKAVAEWAEHSPSHHDWAGLGRSLVLSVLSLSGDSDAASAGSLPAALIRSDEGDLAEAGGRLSAARIYRTLDAGANAPRAVSLGTGGMWAWTAASTLSVVQESDPLIIAVTFPVSETHYLMLRGVRPFYRIQIYNMDWRSDPQFERYDSSGWVYNTQDQILTLKMRHREQLEHIRIYFQPPPPPPRIETPEPTEAE